MKKWPGFNENGDLPTGIHQASLKDVIEHFGKGTFQRSILGQRLHRIYTLAVETKQVARFVVFGSFVTNKPNPGDLDIFLLMEDTVDVRKITGEVRIIFDHMAAQNYEGASIFWVRRMVALGGEQRAIEHWQIRRDGKKRGIVEVLTHDSQ
jgi:predicted nucleotidyltransferase